MPHLTVIVLQNGNDLCGIQYCGSDHDGQGEARSQGLGSCTWRHLGSWIFAVLDLLDQVQEATSAKEPSTAPRPDTLAGK